MKRVFLIVLDSVGIGAMPDAAEYGDEGSNTLGAASRSARFSMPNMEKLGLFDIEGVNCGPKLGGKAAGAVARMKEASSGKEDVYKRQVYGESGKRGNQGRKTFEILRRRGSSGEECGSCRFFY